MKKEITTVCYCCQYEIAEHIRKVIMRRKNGYKLIDFEAYLCKECNTFDDKTLSDYFNM